MRRRAWSAPASSAWTRRARRATPEVSSTVNPITLAKMETLIRERTNMILDGLPRGETFNWVEHVSLELTSDDAGDAVRLSDPRTRRS